MKIMDLLNQYQAVRGQEEAAKELVKTYSRRRQKAYTAFLKEMQALHNAGHLTEQVERQVNDRLDAIKVSA